MGHPLGRPRAARGEEDEGRIARPGDGTLILRRHRCDEIREPRAALFFGLVKDEAAWELAYKGGAGEFPLALAMSKQDGGLAHLQRAVDLRNRVAVVERHPHQA